MTARYTLIKGNFPIVGTEPDGDTVRFQPDAISLVAGLGPKGQRPSFSHGGLQINVRFEAIDALETHFAGTRQQVALGDLATQRMETLLGFQSVRAGKLTVTAATPESVRGYVLANSLDSYGRMIAFVFAGEAAEADGTPIFLTAPRMAESINIQLLEQGVVYPAFYTTLPVELKNYLAAQTRVIRERKIGLWPQDAPSLDADAAVPDLASAEALVMWPKLFRRLSSYFASGSKGLAGFDAWLRQDPRKRDDYLQLPTGELGNMHDLVQITGDRMKLRFRPEDLVVLPDTFVQQPNPGPEPEPNPPPAQTPAPAPTPAPADVKTLRIVAALVDPAGTDAGHETVTLLNTTPSPLHLTGWQLRDRQLQAAAKAGQALAGTIGAGEAMRIAVTMPVQLGNGGDDIVLINPHGQVADTVTYTAAMGRKQGMTLVF